MAGLAYCIGSIDLKPLKISKKEDFEKCMDLNFFPIIEIIKGLQNNLKTNNGSIVLFSTVAAKKGFTNHSIISSVNLLLIKLSSTANSGLVAKYLSLNIGM